MPYQGLTAEQSNALEFVNFPHKLALKLTRMLRDTVRSDFSNQSLVVQNNIINIAHNVLRRPLYELDVYEENYWIQEHGWHQSRLEGIFRFASSTESVDILGDLITEGYLDKDDVNALMDEFNIPVHFSSYCSDPVSVEVFDLPKIEDGTQIEHSPNIQELVARADRSIRDNDPSLALHTCATIYETLGKEVVSSPSIENQTFGSFIEGYRKESKLPNTFVDYMLEIYKRRNTEPNAGHGATKPVKVTIEEATVFTEVTKALIKAERLLQKGQQIKGNH